MDLSTLHKIWYKVILIGGTIHESRLMRDRNKKRLIP